MVIKHKHRAKTDTHSAQCQTQEQTRTGNIKTTLMSKITNSWPGDKLEQVSVGGAGMPEEHWAAENEN